MIRQRIATGSSRYLATDLPGGPDSGRASDLLVAGAMAAMFFTPLGGKIFGSGGRALWRGAKGVGRGARSVGEHTYKAVQSADYMSIGRGIKSGALGAYRGATATARYGATTMDLLARNRGVLAPAAMGGAVAFGGLSAVTTPSQGMPADNLGATGDLTLALHNGRR